LAGFTTTREFKSIPEVCPGDLKELLLPYQREAPDLMLKSLRKRGKALDWSSMGVGKTYMLAAVAQASGLRPFVICRKNHLTETKRVYRSFGCDAEVSNYEKIRTGRTGWGGWYAAGRKAKRFHWSLPSDSLLIMDEHHKCRAIGGMNTQMMVSSIMQNVPMIIASATPAESPIDMQALGYFLGMHRLMDYFPWMLRNGVKITRYGPKYYGDTSFMDKVRNLALPEYGNCILPSQLGDQFPMTYIDAKCYDSECAEEIKQAYRSAARDIDALREDKRKRGVGFTRLGRLQTAHQIVELAKTRLTAELVEDSLEVGRACPVFVNFRESLSALHRLLAKHKPSMIYGQQKDRDRQIERFQTGETDVILLMIQAGGESISLHAKAGMKPREAYISPCWSGFDLKQVLGRVRRAGGQDSFQHVVFVAGTQEEKACVKVRARLTNIEAMTDSDSLGEEELFA